MTAQGQSLTHQDRVAALCVDATNLLYLSNYHTDINNSSLLQYTLPINLHGKLMVMQGAQIDLTLIGEDELTLFGETI